MNEKGPDALSEREQLLELLLNDDSETDDILGEFLPLSFAQERLWFLNQLSNGTDVSYNVPIALRLRGALDVEALTEALNRLVERHEMLRATFAVDDDRPIQKIASAVPLDVQLIDVPPVEIASHVDAHARHTFDLGRGPLVHARILRVDKDHHILLLNMHHIVADGWSLGVFVRELSALYSHCLLGQSADLPDLPVQYADYAHWQRQALEDEAARAQLDYWLAQLAGAPRLLDLPTDRPRPPRMTGCGAQVRFAIPSMLRDALKALSAREGVTLFMTLLAAYTTLLHRISGQRDILIGTPIAGRTRPEFESIIGCFVNTVVLRCTVDSGDSFVAHLHRISATAMTAYENQDLPFEVLVEHLQPQRSLGHTPVFQVMMALQNIPIGSFSLPGLTVEPVVQNLTATKFDLNLSLSERETEIAAVLEYNTDIFDSQTVNELVRSFLALLADVSTGPITRRLDQLTLTDDARAAHWRSHIERGAHRLDFPKERPAGSDSPQPRPARVDIELPEEAATRLLALAREEGASAEHVLLAAFAVLLFRITRQTDFAIGVAEAETSPWRLLSWDMAGDPTFHATIGRARAMAEAAAEFALPLKRINSLCGSESNQAPQPIFSASFSCGEAGPGAAIDVSVSPLHLAINLGADRCIGVFHFNETQLASSDARRYGRMFEHLLCGLAAEPDAAVSRAPLLSSHERDRILRGLNPIRRESVAENSLAAPFEACARRLPNAVALVGSEGELSYRDLDERSSRLAHYLRANGLSEGGRAAIMMSRGFQMVVALYAVSKAGAAYVPLDPELPDGRLALMLREAEVDCLLVQSDQRERMPAGDWQIVVLETLEDALRAMPADSIALRQPPGGIAYLMYTSGSTGSPKAVQYPIEGAIASVRWLQMQYPVLQGDRHVLKTPFGFDVSIWELLWPLYYGGTLVICDPDGHRDPEYLRALIECHQVTCANFVPSMLQVFLDELPPNSCPSLRWILSGGEALLPHLRDCCFERLPQAKLVNLCGPTETHSVADIIVPAEAGSRFVPLGRPSAAFRLYVLDDWLEPMPIGVAGELYIGGDVGLAHGYFGSPALTADRFLPDPFGSPGARMYRSGDICRYFDDGVLEHLGRADRQVKIRGARIELSEIESALAAHDAVRASAVIAVGDGADRRLVGFVVPADDAIVDPDAVTRQIAEVLPRPMVPAPILSIAEIPISINGKVDSAALEEVWRATQAETDGSDLSIAPRGGTEERLARLFGQVLGRPEIDVTRSFFEIGGHSLLAFKLTAACEREFGIVLPMAALFTKSSVRELATEIEAAGMLRDNSLVALDARPEPRDIVAFLVHDITGTPIPFRHLAKRLAADFSVYGFQAPGLEGGGDALQSPQAYAEFYVNVAEQVRGDRPIVLIGWSYGGAIAIELARLWDERGVAVDATILLDSFVLGPPPPGTSRLPGQEEAESVLGTIDYLGRDFAGSGCDGPEAAVADRLGAMLKANLRSFVRHVPERFHGTIDLFRAAGGFPGLTGSTLSDYTSPSRSWEHFVDEVATHDIEGDHFDLLSDHYCDGLASRVRSVVTARRMLEGRLVAAGPEEDHLSTRQPI